MTKPVVDATRSSQDWELGEGFGETFLMDFTEPGDRGYTSPGKESLMPSSTLTAKGQVTIPKGVRDRLGLTEGDRLEFVFDDQGRLIVQPESENRLGRLRGRLKHLAPSRPFTVEEMRDAVLERAKQKHARSADR